MNKVFNNVQLFKSSDDCDKFSKSVSYETLVAGTTTTGRECGEALEIEGVITRRTLVRRGYLPEQATHEKEESLFASVTCFMRLPRRIQRMLLVMAIPALALLFTIATTSESSAECVGATETTAGTDTITGAHCGICGTNCNWKIDGDTLKVTGGANGEIGHMNAGAKYINDVYTYVMPWKDLFNEFSKVDISGVENVGNAAFRTFSNITDIKLDDAITSIGLYAFSDSNIKTVILPDSLKSLGYRAFSGVNHSPLEEVIISDTLANASSESTFGDNPEQLNNLKIICLGDTQKCQNALANYVYWDGSKPEEEGFIPFSLAGNVRPADYKYCNTTNYFWNGASCIREPDLSKRKCCSSCKDVGGYCNRIRYTPAEAAQVLKDDNTNEITITFRK